MNPNPEVDARIQETQAIVLQASRITVTNPETYKLAAELRAKCKLFCDYFEGLYRPRVEEAWTLHHNLLADLKKLKEPPETQFKRLGILLSDFDRKAEEEKRRLEREAERKRKEAEQEQQRLADLAAELGSTETAEEIEEKPVDPGPVIAKAVPKVEGLSYRHGGWSWAIENRDLIPDDFWIVDERSITAIVNRLGKQAEKVVGGIVVVEKPKIPIQR